MTVASVRVPATVQAVLAARIDRLPPDAKALLQTASVDRQGRAGRAAAGRRRPRRRTSSRRGLAALQAAEFLYEASLFPELEYTFKHALTHEVAYGSLLQERRKTLHARIVAAIERLYADRLDEHVERLAHHALRAETLGRSRRAMPGRRRPGQLRAFGVPRGSELLRPGDCRARPSAGDARASRSRPSSCGSTCSRR